MELIMRLDTASQSGIIDLSIENVSADSLEKRDNDDDDDGKTISGYIKTLLSLSLIRLSLLK